MDTNKKNKYIAPRIDVVIMDPDVSFLLGSQEQKDVPLEVVEIGFYGNAKNNKFGLVPWEEYGEDLE